jgi:hypothetical protein
VTKDDRLLAVYESEFVDGDDDGIVGRMFAVRGTRVVAGSATSASDDSRSTRSGGSLARDLGTLTEGRSDGAPATETADHPVRR